MNYRILLILLFFVCFSRVAEGQASSYGELQAAYLFNFAKYIKWPKEPTVFVIGVYGDADILDDLKKVLQNKKVGGVPIEIREFSSDEELTTCHIVYLSEPDSKKVSELASSLRKANTLIVSEEDLVKKGATISFVVEADRLRFKLSRSALRESGLVASEGLLKLAIQI